VSTTRLLVLGVLRFMQPCHGYELRRELMTWQIEDWTNVKPGSIYSALKTLEKDGLIASAGADRTPGRPERISYRMTAEGEREFQLMLRESWWRVANPIEPLAPALGFMLTLTRDEVIAAVDSRVVQLQVMVRELVLQRTAIPDGATGEDGAPPEHVREMFSFLEMRHTAEIEWARGYLKRIRSGAYVFAGESQPS